MNGRFLKALLAVILSASLFAGANAAMITVEDINGVKWEYVGSFHLSDGVFWNDANDCDLMPDPTGCVLENAQPLNGIQAAIAAFGPLGQGQYVTSTEQLFVNRNAWYDSVSGAVSQLSDNLIADFNGDGIYSMAGDLSAYVQDSYVRGSNPFTTETFVFKSISAVSAPSLFALFALALCGLGLRKLKR
ncbi:MAG: hypothetical protein ACJA0G_001763 [Kangiellaceae bacterium]|jgi:hypothetical protein